MPAGETQRDKMKKKINGCLACQVVGPGILKSLLSLVELILALAVEANKCHS